MRRIILLIAFFAAVYFGVNHADQMTDSPGGMVVMSIVLCIIYLIVTVVILIGLFGTKDWISRKMEEHSYY
jgi:uncharacterized membrane protein